MGSDMIEAKEMSLISSMMDDIKVLRKRIEEMEERLQMLADLHSESELEVRDDYLAHLDELEEKGKFEEFADIGELRQRIERAEN
jgi:hypothetical protein